MSSLGFLRCDLGPECRGYYDFILKLRTTYFLEILNIWRGGIIKSDVADSVCVDDSVDFDIVVISAI